MDIEECQRECDTILKAYMAELQRQYDGSRPASTEFLNRYKIILDSAELSAERALQFAKMNSAPPRLDFEALLDMHPGTFDICLELPDTFYDHCLRASKLADGCPERRVLLTTARNQYYRAEMMAKTDTINAWESSENDSTLIDSQVIDAGDQGQAAFTHVWRDGLFMFGKVAPAGVLATDQVCFDRITRSGWTSACLVRVHGLLQYKSKEMLIMNNHGFPLSQLVVSHALERASPPVRSSSVRSIAVSAAIGTLSALSVLARAGLSHNDVKPSNLLCSTSVPYLTTLVDLGSVREWQSADMPAITPGMGDTFVVNTPAYDVGCLRSTVRMLSEIVECGLEDLHDLVAHIDPTRLTNLQTPDDVAEALWSMAVNLHSFAMRQSIPTVDIDAVRPTQSTCC
ncbi:hypothetical protein PBRA_009344 [Plasmodiophora brassicae]|nr:hypothetical protein PBRA_009344 [Plasmodiophora brassicae]